MNTSLLNRFTLIQRFSPSGCKKGLWKKKYSQITNRLTKDKYLPLSPGDICRHWCGSTCPRPPRTGSAFIHRCRWQQGAGASPCPGLGAASGLGTGPGRASRRVRSSLSQKKHDLGLIPQLGERRGAALHIAVRGAGLGSGRGVPGAGGEYTT